MNRRTFLQSSLAVTGAASLGSVVAHASAQNQVAGANDRIRVGVVGVKSRGREHIKQFGEMKNVEVAALVQSRLIDLP